MLVGILDALRSSDWVSSRASERAIRLTSFQIYRNGVLDHVVNGPERLVRNRLRSLRELFPEDCWEYAPTRHWRDLS